MSDIRIDYRQPRADLAEHFSFFYSVQQSCGVFDAFDRADFAQFRFVLGGDSGRFTFVDGTVQTMPEIYVLGPTTGSTHIRGEGLIDVIGVGLMPEGWASLVPMDASAAANRAFDARDLFGEIAGETLQALRAAVDFDARVAIFQAMLVTLIERQHASYHAFVRTVNTWLADAAAPDVDALVARTGLSARQVQRSCKRYFGSPPKLLARKYRALRAAVALSLQDDDLDQILADGFYDQSHLTRELKHFTGMTPGEYAQQPTELNRELAKRIALERAHPLQRAGIIT